MPETNGHGPHTGNSIDGLIAEGRVSDTDALYAAADVVGRSGASDLEIGVYEADQPNESDDWYAVATYSSDGPLGVDGNLVARAHAGPVEAVEALARRLLSGAYCARCQRTVTLDSDKPGDYCRWTRMGRQWVGSCEAYQ